MQADLLVLTASAWQGVGGRGERERFVSSLSQAGCLFPRTQPEKGSREPSAPPHQIPAARTLPIIPRSERLLSG